MTNPHDSSDSNAAETTHFGFQTVAKHAKANMVKGVFDSVASRYDVMNDVMSGGLHRLWKAEMVEWLHPTPDMKILDVAGGTGDIAFRIREHCQKRFGAMPHITLCDINDHMLTEGKKRAVDNGIFSHIEWICGDAQYLPVEDASIDAYTIAFGIRNVTDISLALKEAYRVLRPGGRFLCLEFSHVPAKPLAKIYDNYSMHVIPRMGQLIARDAASYQYLVESIRKFPTQSQFSTLIRDQGFGNVSYRNMTCGVVAMHSGWKI
ncbi:MAG: bifunctional demethylmenaquinone methyltransferase/2-methoxy-6-polyprenyl-1,4-benzoquinol methylase UbiE [Alphaproteobacteria bacterium]|nr:bifunctional demethylmenaquinone methyltransferase/2-methoxy-6-polyprenyl-1,4-benzoquinol methylase UbiE [Alphaproteobacteria bacterium]